MSDAGERPRRRDLSIRGAADEGTRLGLSIRDNLAGEGDSTVRRKAAVDMHAQIER